MFASGPWFEAKTLTEFEAYEVLSHLGRGTFGQVLKVRSADNRAFALKVIRNRPAFLQQAEVEVELLPPNDGAAATVLVLEQPGTTAATVVDATSCLARLRAELCSTIDVQVVY